MPNNIPPCKTSQRKEISIIELMPFHHEVWLAFCLHAINLGININIKASRNTGIYKAINGIAADSLKSLYLIAKEKSVQILLDQESSLEKLFFDQDAIHSVFIGTIPDFGLQSIRKKPAMADQLLELIRNNLELNRKTLLTIHDPRRDLRQLRAVFTDHEINQFNYITLSSLTAKTLADMAPKLRDKILIMPTLSISSYQGRTTAWQGDQQSNPILIVPGEISSKRRNYQELSRLSPIGNRLNKNGFTIMIVGRIKRESWIDKLASMVPIPISWIFYLKFPLAATLRKQNIIDLSFARRRKLDEPLFQKILSSSWALLDVQLNRYKQMGITSGLNGLSLAHTKPVISIDQLLDFFQNSSDRESIDSFKQYLRTEEKRLLKERVHQADIFRASLAAHIYGHKSD